MLDMSRDEIELMLCNARIGRLCMAGRDGHPYAIPMPFCWTDNTLYLRVRLTGRKGAILSSNNQVCFEIDECSDDLQEYASVLIEGRLLPVSSLDEKLHVKQVNDEKYHRLRRGHRPGHGRSTPLDALPLQKIQTERIGGRRKDPSCAVRQAITAVEAP